MEEDANNCRHASYFGQIQTNINGILDLSLIQAEFKKVNHAFNLEFPDYPDFFKVYVKNTGEFRGAFADDFVE